MWKSIEDQRPQIPTNNLTPKKCLLLIAFTCNKRISVKALPYGRTIDGDVYEDFVNQTGIKWRKLRTDPIHLEQLVWQHDNARPHTKSSVVSFFDRRRIELLQQPPYSPDLNLCDRWINEHIKAQLREVEFDNHEDVEREVIRVLRNTDPEVYRKELDKLLDHCSKVIACGGSYITPS